MGKGCDLSISYKPGLHTCAVYCAAADKNLFHVLFPRPAATGYYLNGDLRLGGLSFGKLCKYKTEMDMAVLMQFEQYFDFISWRRTRLFSNFV